jgi:hypothetical protein
VLASTNLKVYRFYKYSADEVPDEIYCRKMILLPKKKAGFKVHGIIVEYCTATIKK